MYFLKKTIIKDLLNGNVVIGPDGGLWYPSGPEETYTLESLLKDLIAPNNVLNKRALLAAVNEMAEQIRPQIQKQVTEYLKGQTSEISRALVDGLIGSLQSSWSVKVQIGSFRD